VRGPTETLASEEAADFSGFLTRFRAKHSAPIEGACFGAPGPVVAHEVIPTNLDWKITEDQIRAALGIASVKLVNDLEATAAAIPHLQPEQVLTLYEGRPRQHSQRRYVVLAPGTGLGQAFLVFSGREPVVFPSEGGHADFAPTSPLQLELLRYLMRRFPRVSYEHVLSGPGLENIYDFLRDTVGPPTPAALTERFKREDRAKVISEAGLEGEDALCTQALDLFAVILGAHAGDLALSFVAHAGVFLGGGIPPKIREKLREGPTVEAFLRKEKMADLVGSIPLRIILDDHAALLGAASIAARLAEHRG
jgi:glucokinase